MSDVPEGQQSSPGQGQPSQPTSARLPGQGDQAQTQPVTPGSPPAGQQPTGPQPTQPYGYPATQPNHQASPQQYPGPQGSFPLPPTAGRQDPANTGGHDKATGKGVGTTFAAAGTAALLAAALASAATYGIVRANGSNGAIETGNKTILNANPADFADAGTVNWAATAAKVNPSVVAITVISASGDGDQGSGVVLDNKGNIVTNNHVVAAAGRNGKVQVTLNNNRSYAAHLVGTDPDTDLAVIRIDGTKDLTPATLGDDEKLLVGQPVMAVGNPLGLAGTVTTGIVSALNRPVKTAGDSSSSSASSDDTVFTNAIQTSAAINPGNSGGALVDGSGKLIGINSSIASLSSSSSSGGQSGNIGIGFAIPTRVVKNITNQLISSGKAQHALLGIATKDDEVSDGNATLSAARVAEVEKGGAADKAGIETGDEVISIDGDPVTSSDALVGAVRARQVGSKVKLTILRNDQRKEIEVTLGSKESQ